MTRQGSGNLPGPQKVDPRVRRNFAGLNRNFKGSVTFQLNTGSTVNVAVTDNLIVSTGDNGGFGNATINLPSVDDVADGHVITIKNADPLGTHNVIVSTDGSEEIDGNSADRTLNQYNYIVLLCADVDGSSRQWLIIGSS